MVQVVLGLGRCPKKKLVKELWCEVGSFGKNRLVKKVGKKGWLLKSVGKKVGKKGW